jgi:Ca2+-binding RTX toxin-like protein
MAKVLYTDDLFDHENLSSFDADSFELKSIQDDSLTFADDNGAKMVLHGDDIEKQIGEVTDGTITSAEFYNADGDKIYTFKDVDMSAADIYMAYSFNHNPNRVMHGLMNGDDTVAGSKYDDSLWGFNGNDILKGGLGDDLLYGHAGNDTLTGGKGADSFTFLTGTGHDTVTDFDVTGDDHDLIYVDYYLYKSMTTEKDGKDLVLTLETGDQMTLENVRKADLGIDHFDFF